MPIYTAIAVLSMIFLLAGCHDEETLSDPDGKGPVCKNTASIVCADKGN